MSATCRRATGPHRHCLADTCVVNLRTVAAMVVKITVEAFASDLAWYQSPRLATVKVGEDRKNPFQLREGVTSAELRAELLEMFSRGLRPSEGVLPELMDLTAEKDFPVEAADGVANREE